MDGRVVDVAVVLLVATSVGALAAAPGATATAEEPGAVATAEEPGAVATAEEPGAVETVGEAGAVATSSAPGNVATADWSAVAPTAGEPRAVSAPSHAAGVAGGQGAGAGDAAGRADGAGVAAARVDGPEPAALVELEPNGSGLWPYTSRTPSIAGRTLAINVVVYGDRAAVRRVFLREADGNWSRRQASSLPANGGDGAADPEPAVGDVPLDWREAHGATRYTYVAPAGDGGRGQWVDESYQLYDGSYLGSRYHVRAYRGPDGSNWTAMQAHAEYWDWFRLRHTVTGIGDGQRRVEADFADAPFVERLWRRNLENATSRGDGWATVIELAGTAALVGLVGRGRPDGSGARRRVRDAVDGYGGAGTRRALVLGGSLVCVYVGVRVGAVALEEALGGRSPTVIAAAAYPVVAAGLPLCAYAFGRRVDPDDAFLAAAVGLAVAFLLDHAYLGLVAVPIDLLLYRVTLALALGLVAAGAATRARGGPRWNDPLRLGIGGWIGALALALAGLI